MSDLFFNRKDESDIVVSGRYQVAKDKEVRIGYPLKEAGSLGGGANPVYTKYRLVEEYDDVTSVATCIGVAEDQIRNFNTIEGGDLRNLEFRHFRRDVAVVQFGIRKMFNVEASAALETGEAVMPYTGGVRKWVAGKVKLGWVHQGPIPAGKAGEIMISVGGQTA